MPIRAVAAHTHTHTHSYECALLTWNIQRGTMGRALLLIMPQDMETETDRDRDRDTFEETSLAESEELPETGSVGTAL